MTDVEKLAGVVAAATKGPWVYEYTCIGYTVRQPGEMYCIATTNHSADPENDARLIAMAPDLAAECLRLTAALAERDATIAGLVATNGLLVVRENEARTHLRRAMEFTALLMEDPSHLEETSWAISARAWLAGKPTP